MAGAFVNGDAAYEVVERAPVVTALSDSTEDWQ